MVGNHLGDLKSLTDHYLPKSAIDKATFRMSELLKQRFGTQEPDNKLPEITNETIDQKTNTSKLTSDNVEDLL